MRFAIGDSHSVFFGQSGLTQCHWTGAIGKATIYQILKQGLDIFSLRQEIIHSEHTRECGYMPWQTPNSNPVAANNYYIVPNIKEGDEVIFCFGYNDIQKNINKYHKDNVLVEINRLIDGYINLILIYNIKPYISSIAPNPRISEIDGKYLHGIFGDFEVQGSDTMRLIYTLNFNMILEKKCKENNIKFLDMYADLNEGRYIKKEYTTDGVHLDYSNKELVEKIRIKLEKL